MHNCYGLHFLIRSCACNNRHGQSGRELFQTQDGSYNTFLVYQLVTRLI